jgi:hypothetical protein
MGDIFSSTDTKNLVVLIFYGNLQLIHNFLQNIWPVSPLPRRPTNFEEKCLIKTGWKSCRLVEPNNFSKQIAVRDKIPEDILHFAEKL